MMIHSHRGKGEKDRYIPLPAETLALLRKYWVTHRHPKPIFPALGPACNAAPSPIIPWTAAAFKAPSAKANMPQASRRNLFPFIRSVTVLRPIRRKPVSTSGALVIQQYPGHAQLETTMIYPHLTKVGNADAYKIMNSEMKGFKHDPDK